MFADLSAGEMEAPRQEFDEDFLVELFGRVRFVGHMLGWARVSRTWHRAWGVFLAKLSAVDVPIAASVESIGEHVARARSMVAALRGPMSRVRTLNLRGRVLLDVNSLLRGHTRNARVMNAKLLRSQGCALLAAMVSSNAALQELSLGDSEVLHVRKGVDVRELLFKREFWQFSSYGLRDCGASFIALLAAAGATGGHQLEDDPVRVPVVNLNLSGNRLTDSAALVLGYMLDVSASLTELNLGFNQIADVGAIALGKALVVNASLTELYLNCNQIGDAGAIGLAESLTVNASLTELHLGFNQIADAGAIALGKALAVNASLTELYLNSNQIADAGAIGLAEGLKVNASLATLWLGGNQIADAGAVALAEGLKDNSSLTKLSLINNQITDAGAIAPGKGLAVNASLTKLYLSGNQIADAGAVALGKALAVNASLTELGLGANKIGDSGAISLVEGLNVNTSLTMLRLNGNKIGEMSMSAIKTAWSAKPGRGQSDLYFDV